MVVDEIYTICGGGVLVIGNYNGVAPLSMGMVKIARDGAPVFYASVIEVRKPFSPQPPQGSKIELSLIDFGPNIITKGMKVFLDDD